MSELWRLKGLMALTALLIEIVLIPAIVLLILAACEEGTNCHDAERNVFFGAAAGTWLGALVCIGLMGAPRAIGWRQGLRLAALSWMVVAHVGFLLWATPQFLREGRRTGDDLAWFASFLLVSVPIVTVCLEKLLVSLFDEQQATEQPAE
jgi:hypothetical protein